MNRARRKTHDRVWIALAIALPLLFVLALRARHEPPSEPLPPALVSGATP